MKTKHTRDKAIQMMAVGASHTQKVLLDLIRRGEIEDACRVLPDLTLREIASLRSGASRLAGNTRDGITIVRVGTAVAEGE
jgi:hypothetical protein